MPQSKVNICNIALASIGADSIRDFDETNKRASLCDRFFEPTRDYLLTKFDWPFARKFKKLQKVVVPEDEVPFGTYAYQLPEDCKTPRSLYPLGSRDRWEVIGDALFTDVENAGLYYTRKETNVTMFSDTFSMLLSLGIATRIAPPIAQDMKLAATIYDQYVREQRECWESDANIGNNYREPDEDPNNDTFVYPDLARISPNIIT